LKKLARREFTDGMLVAPDAGRKKFF